MDGLEFKRRATRYAKKNGLEYRLDKARGKGSHQILRIGGHKTTIKKSEISESLLHDMLKHLKIKKEEFSMRYAYPCQLTPDEDGKGGFLATFPDIIEARTCGKDRAEALEMAEDALSVALGSYVKDRQDIPIPSPVMDGQEVVPVQPIVAAKLELYSAMLRHRVTRVALAKRLGLSHTSVSKIVDPDHRSHISQVEKALRAVGRGLIIEGRAIAGREEDMPWPKRQRRVA